MHGVVFIHILALVVVCKELTVDHEETGLYLTVIRQNTSDRHFVTAWTAWILGVVKRIKVSP